MRIIDWQGVELEYRTGRALRAIGQRFGCTHTAVRKRAERSRWMRDLAPKIHGLADQLVSNDGVSKVSTPQQIERQRIETDAHIEASIRIAHRRDIAGARRLVGQMLSEFAEAGVALPSANDRDGSAPTGALPNACPPLGQLERSRIIRTLVDALGRLVELERSAYGIDADNLSSTPFVIVRDFTGRVREELGV